jgi:uncharacterized YigZ family protein
MKSYYIISHPQRYEQELKKSNFIAQASPVHSKQEALAYIAQIKETNKTATHNCWAYIIGNPGGTDLGMSDDGEPQGTAGRPMLSYLQNREMGDVVVVVTRYSSGIKLGTGGLVRAYTSSIQEVIEAGTPQLKVAMSTFNCTYHYTFDDQLRRIFLDYSATITHQEFSDSISLTIEVPTHFSEALRDHLNRETNASIHITD